MIKALLISDGKNVTYTEDLTRIKQAVAGQTDLLWVDLLKPEEAELDFLKDTFSLNSYCLKECLEYSKNAKLEEFDNYLFLVSHVLDDEAVSFPELHIFLARGYLITVHFNPVKELEEYWNRLLKQLYDGNHGMDFLLYNILDAVGDTYLKAVELIADSIEDLEELVFDNGSTGILPGITTIRRKLIYLRRQLNSEVAVLEKLTRPDLEFFTKRSRLLMRDIHDKFSRILHFIEVNRELNSTVYETYLTMLSLQANETANEQNRIMQRLTVITAIFMPLTLIAGIYGMNFGYMPELEWRAGYFFVLGLMLVLGLVLYYYFKRKHWLS